MTDTKMKQQFRVELWPVLDLLNFKKQQLSPGDWARFVDRTKLSIITNPSQFLGGDLPSRLIIQTAIDEIFVEYLTDEIPV